METVVALKGILLNAIPTFCLVWVLYFYVSRFFLAPLEKVLHKRHEATEGLRKAAAERVSTAAQKATAYEETLRSSSAEVYRQQEQGRQQMMEQRAEMLRQARAKAEERVRVARQGLEQEIEAAKRQLGQESESIAQWITRAILDQPPTAAPPAGRLAASI